MSTIRHPVGPQPKRVYWRRRLVMLFVLVAIVAIVLLIVVRPGGGAEGGTPAGSSAGPSGAGGSASTSTPAPGSLEGGGGDAAAGGDAATEAGGPCAPADLAVVPVTDATNYAASATPQFSFTITNTGSVACTVNAGTSQQVYTVTSGDEVYWTSTDCQTDPSDTEALLEPGVAVTSTPFAWDRTRSAPDTCAAPDRPQVPGAGASYHLSVSVAGIPSAATQQFILN